MRGAWGVVRRIADDRQVDSGDAAVNVYTNAAPNPSRSTQLKFSPWRSACRVDHCTTMSTYEREPPATFCPFLGLFHWPSSQDPGSQSASREKRAQRCATCHGSASRPRRALPTRSRAHSVAYHWRTLEYLCGQWGWLLFRLPPRPSSRLVWPWQKPPGRRASRFRGEEEISTTLVLGNISPRLPNQPPKSLRSRTASGES